MSLSSAEKYLSVQSVKGRKSCVKWAWGFREKYNYTKDRDETILTTRHRSLASCGSSRNSLNHNFFHFSSHNSSYYMESIFFAPVLSDSLPLMFLATWNVLHSEEAEGERLQTIKLGASGRREEEATKFLVCWLHCATSMRNHFGKTWSSLRDEEEDIQEIYVIQSDSLFAWASIFTQWKLFFKAFMLPLKFRALKIHEDNTVFFYCMRNAN